MARAASGTFLLRIEDIDLARSKRMWEAQILEDLAWLGLTWDAAPVRQSERQHAYDTALDSLWARGLVYPCSCTRRDVLEAASAPQEGVAPPAGPDGLVYPGTCRRKPKPRARPRDTALRLDLRAALAQVPGPLGFTETGAGPRNETGCIAPEPATLPDTVGDVVLARRDMGTSYHLSVVLDDAFQKVTHVVRGADLFSATLVHVLLQRLTGCPSPIYHHHRLIRDEAGKRLAKRDDARAIAAYRADGFGPDDIRRMVGLRKVTP